jgi:hypothetical protein
MIKLNHNLSLDLYYNEEKTIDTKEYDKNSRYITVSLTFKGEEYKIAGDSVKARVKWLKPDKKAVFNDCVINSDNTVTIDLTEQMLIASGVAKATLSLYDINTNQVLSSTSFNAIIEASAVSDDTILSSDEYNSLHNEFKRLNDKVEELDKTVTEHENIREKNEDSRKTNEIKRESNESKRINSENTRINNENKRIDSEDERVKNENTRIANENTRQHNEATRETQEDKRESDTAIAIEKANEAAKNANDKSNDLQNKLDNHHFVLTDELENSVSSTSTTHAPTANAVKTVYDKAVSVENTINSNKNNWNDKYTKNEIDNKFSTLESNIDWKESVNSYADIAKTYPNPEDGWTVNVRDTDYTYRYSGSAWVAISANAIPKATQSLDGLLSKEDKSNYDDANNKKHTHTNKSVLDGITSALIAAWNSAVKHITDTVKHITPSERTNWNAAYDKANDALPKTGGILTGSLDIYGNASQNPLRTRGIVGSDGQGKDGDLYLQYGSAGNIYLGKNGSGCIDEDGKSYNGTAMSSRYPFGFNSYTPADITWGVQTGTPLVAWNTSNGGSIGFRDNCPASGQVSMVIDGRVYQDEGRYPVLDSNNYTSVITKQGICDILGYTPSSEDLESALSIRDYNDTSKKIKVGWVGSALNEDQILAIACYASGDDDTVKAKVKDVTKDTFKSWLGTVLAANNAAHLGRNGNAGYPMTFNWAGKDGQPTWLWGGENGSDMYVYNPSNFSVNYAASAGNAAKVNDHTVDSNVPSNAKFTDTNTWRGIQDNLTSASTVESLSANQGRKLANGSARDSTKIPLTGSTEITGNLIPKTHAEKTLGDSTHYWKEAYINNVYGEVNGHAVNADVPSNAVFTDTKGSVASNNGISSGYAMLTLASGYKILAFHTAARNYAMTNTYGNMYWASFEIPIPVTGIKYFTSVNITPFATSGLISVSITNYTVSKIQGFVFSPLAETKSISFHVTLHGTAS